MLHRGMLHCQAVVRVIADRPIAVWPPQGEVAQPSLPSQFWVLLDGTSFCPNAFGPNIVPITRSSGSSSSSPLSCSSCSSCLSSCSLGSSSSGSSRGSSSCSSGVSRGSSSSASSGASLSVHVNCCVVLSICTARWTRRTTSTAQSMSMNAGLSSWRMDDRRRHQCRQCRRCRRPRPHRRRRHR